MARIVGVDIPNDKPVGIALTYIYGVGRTTAAKVCATAKVDAGLRVKDLSDEDYNYLKVKFTTEEWKSFNNEQSISILALVNLRFNNNPEISYTQKIDLNDII